MRSTYYCTFTKIWKINIYTSNSIYTASILRRNVHIEVSYEKLRTPLMDKEFENTFQILILLMTSRNWGRKSGTIR